MLFVQLSAFWKTTWMWMLICLPLLLTLWVLLLMV